MDLSHQSSHYFAHRLAKAQNFMLTCIWSYTPRLCEETIVAHLHVSQNVMKLWWWTP